MARRVVLYLIRHEKTAANYARRYIGWTDEPIARDVTATLPIRPSIVYGSDLLRCQQTAACYFPQAQYVANRDFRESHFGQFEMKTYEQLKDNPQYRAWIDCPGNNPPPEGEHFTTFTARVQKGLAEIVQQPGVYTFVIHGGVMRVLLAQFLQQDFREVTAEHRIIYRVEWDTYEAFKEGQACKLLSAEPITVKETM